MNARSFRANLRLSLLDFDAKKGLVESSVSDLSKPHINKQNLVLTITNKYVLTDMNTNREHGALSIKSDYEIPLNLLRIRKN